MVRELLTADRTLYVRSDALYSDAPGRLDSVAGACLTWQQAVNLAAALDFGGHTVTLQHGAEGAHTFTASTNFPTFTGGGRLIVKGSSTPGDTDFNVSGADTFYMDNTVIPIGFQNLTARGGSGAVFSIVNGTRCEIGSGVIFGAAASYHIWVHDSKSLLYCLNATVTINGSAVCWLFINMGGAFVEASAFTMTGSPAFSGAFVQALSGGTVQSVATTFTGATTGVRYNSSLNSVINTFGGGANYFPGNSAGLTATGGIYA